MIQRVVVRDDVTQEIVARITGALRPWRIVLFGSRARGRPKDDSDYDIYVEIDAPDDRALWNIQSEIVALFRDRRWTLDVKARRPGTLDSRRDDPGTIEWDVAREGILLYADPAAPAVLAPADRVREQSPEPPESLDEWLESALKDLRHRDDLLALGKNDYWPEICWLSHQTIEKHLKALLVSRWVRPARTHDLSELLQTLRQSGLELAGLDADCKLLTEHAITPRYPAGMKLGERDARAASDAADRLIASVRRHLPPRLD